MEHAVVASFDHTQPQLHIAVTDSLRASADRPTSEGSMAWPASTNKSGG